MLQLHVWGPAFGLPSIDPQCLAAITYLSHAVPQGEWELVASSDPTLSPTRGLPTLRDDSVWIGGFQNITHHLQHKYGGQHDLDQDCNNRDRADISAYTSFLETCGQPLLDLSLYVSSENYHASTRPAYSNILQWPNTWLLPPKRRAAAKARTDYLNLSSLDLDTWKDDQATKSQFAAGTEIPKLVAQSAQRKASSLMKQPQHAARFRLETLSESFLEPLAQLQQGKYYLLSEERMTSLDCLALGYLSLALVPEVPQSWLSQSMKSKYPSLCHFVENLARDCWGIELNGRDGKSSGKATATALPWKVPDGQSWSSFIQIRSSLETLPYLGALYRPSALQLSTTKPREEIARVPVLPTVFVGFTASVTALIGYVLYTGEMPSPPAFIRPLIGRQRPQRLADLGAAGAMLGSIRFRESPY